MAHRLAGEKFNIVGEREIDNLSLATLISGYVGRPLHYELTDFHSSRPGHDLRYALDGEKMRKLGWEPPDTIEETLKKTVDWYLRNPEWLGAS
jgi:dTDP-glucose 4,6-dehydratase